MFLPTYYYDSTHMIPPIFMYVIAVWSYCACDLRWYAPSKFAGIGALSSGSAIASYLLQQGLYL